MSLRVNSQVATPSLVKASQNYVDALFRATALRERRAVQRQSGRPFSRGLISSMSSQTGEANAILASRRRTLLQELRTHNANQDPSEVIKSLWAERIGDTPFPENELQLIKSLISIRAR